MSCFENKMELVDKDLDVKTENSFLMPVVIMTTLTSVSVPLQSC